MKKICVIVAFLLTLMILMSACFIPIRKSNSNRKSTSNQSESQLSSQVEDQEFNEFQIHDMTFRVPASMSGETDSRDGDSLLSGASENYSFSDSKGEYEIQFLWEEYTLLTTPNGAATSLFGQIKDTPLWSESMMEEIIINGTSWFHADISEETDNDNLASRADVYVYCDGFQRYGVSFLYTNKADIDYAEVLMPYVVMNYGNQLTGETLVGEWDGGEAGYLVINKDGTLEWFKDASKSEDNVMTATYMLFDKKPNETLVQSDDYYYVVIRYNKNVIEGILTEKEYLRECCFSVEGDTLHFTNIYNSTTSTMTRSKQNVMPSQVDKPSATEESTSLQGVIFGQDMDIRQLLAGKNDIEIDEDDLDELNDNGTMKLDVSDEGESTDCDWSISFIVPDAFYDSEEELLSDFVQKMKEMLNSQEYEYKEGLAEFDTIWTKNDHQFVIDDHSDNGYVNLHFRRGFYME